VHAFYGNLTLDSTDLPASIKLTYPVVPDLASAQARCSTRSRPETHAEDRRPLPARRRRKAHTDLASRRTVGKLLLLLS
jgi:hypothetical protein